ncbi:transmembrane protein 238-like [Erpetoichthys calabaricus]|uniref:transmembrane protein 238-like n=1 Tax=Erpetoichthys calabaricus TaxID=27687 RepID=UPI00109FDE27|nr:transmembrane protein 238-like [Erpetoichthys calabaricus]
MEVNRTGLGRCVCAFWLAVAFDVLGLVVLLVGVFANLYFYDFLIYAGAIIIFLSLIWWVFWYTGNIEVPPALLEDDVGLKKKERGVAGVIRRLSSRLSSGFQSTFSRRKNDQRAPKRTALGSQWSSPGDVPLAATGGEVHTVSAAIDGGGHLSIAGHSGATQTSAI